MGKPIGDGSGFKIGNTSKKGDLGLVKVIGRLIELGMSVYCPDTDQVYFMGDEDTPGKRGYNLRVDRAHKFANNRCRMAEYFTKWKW